MPNIDINKRVATGNYSMNQLHSHTSYEIYFLLEGNRLLFFSDNMYEITKPTVVIIPPHTLHKTEGGPFTRFNISVFPKDLNKFQEHILEKNKLVPITVTGDKLKTIVNLFEEVVNSKEQAYKPFINETAFSYFVYLLSEIEIDHNRRTPSGSRIVPPVILKIMHYLNNNLTKNITLDDISAKFYIAKSTLNYNFKQYTSCTPIEYLLNLRLDKAKRLLVETNKSVEEIAAECGFSSSNYFGTIFKKHVKVSPTTYRKKEY